MEGGGGGGQAVAEEEVGGLWRAGGGGSESDDELCRGDVEGSSGTKRRGRRRGRSVPGGTTRPLPPPEHNRQMPQKT